MNEKILSHSKLVSIIKLLRRQGKIVVVSGSFDIMHAGHIKFFKAAKQHGNILLVLLNSDQSIKKYKGPNRPIIQEQDRAEMVAAISCVDYITLFDEVNPGNIISKIKPDVYCNGSDWGPYCVEREAVESGGGRLVVINRKKTDISTSRIIQNILAIYSKPPVKAVFIDRDGTINDNKDGYVYKIKDFIYLPGVVRALRKLSKTDYKIIIVTNQSGIARGYYSERAYKKLTEFMIKDLRSKGVRVDKVYFCPHHPDADCACRKPKIGMLLRAVSDFGVSLNDSWIIGDDDGDVKTGREANVKTIKIGKINSQTKVRPNFAVNSLAEAIKIVLDKK